MHKLDGTPAGTTIFQAVSLGGGGYMTNISMSNDGLTKACDTDVYNAMVWGEDDTQWRYLFTPSSFSNPGTVPAGSADGKFDIFEAAIGVCVAPSDKTRIYCNSRFYFFVSSNTGQTLQYCQIAPKRMYSNTGAQRYWNDKIAIHPTNPDIALFGTFNDGVYYTTNAGAAVTEISGIPVNTNYGGHPSPYLVAFDPSNGNNVYIFAQGTGVYRSTTGVSGAFSAIAGSPTFCSHLYVYLNGDVWVCNPSGTSGQNVSMWNGTAWTQPVAHAADAGPALTIAISPTDANHICMVPAGMGGVISADGGASWVGNDRYLSGRGISNTAADDIPWLAGRNMFFGKIMFNPAATNELWGAHGVGISVSAPPKAYTAWTWQSRTKGIENLACSNGLSIPGNTRPLFGCWDKPIWRPVDLDIHAGSYTGTTPVGIDHLWQFDFAADDLDYIACASGYTDDTSGYSEDGGATWTDFFPSGFPTGQVGGNGGAIAVNTRANQILIPGNNMRAIYTKDEWATWNYLPIDPNIGGMGNWINANYVRRNLVTADKARPGVFAIIMNGSNQGTGKQGLWVTTDGGDNWTQKKAGRLDSQGDSIDFWSCTLAYIPGKSGELLYATTQATSWLNNRLLHYTSDGASGPSYLGGLTGVQWFGFGKNVEGQSYPALYVLGTVGSVYGLYRSLDFFATPPVLLTSAPNESINGKQALFGDSNIFGRVYVGFNGNGWAYGEYKDMATAT